MTRDVMGQKVATHETADTIHILLPYIQFVHSYQATKRMNVLNSSSSPSLGAQHVAPKVAATVLALEQQHGTP